MNANHKQSEDDRDLTRRIAWDYVRSLVTKIDALEVRVKALESILKGKKDGKG